ncbi:MAG: LysR family transcriptional regulator [Gammaproteobacteria bacterium]|nr:LysR family transcriptional regulator [Gammaproteobacteria bacterium]
MAAPTHLRALQAVELAIRKGSLKAAAAELSITPAALGQRIRGLEDYLGYDLLVRGRLGIRPTTELENATAHLHAAFRELETVSRILDFQRVNEVHITADSDWADLWLKPRLNRFKKDNPNTLFCINGVGDVPLRLGEADCEIWFGEDRGDDGADVLFHDYFVPVGSPENARRIAELPSEEMLEGFPLLHLNCYTRDVIDIGWIEWIRKFGHRKTAPGIGIRYQKVMQALEAVYANAGFLLCGIALIKFQIDEGKLSLAFSITEGLRSKNAYRIRFRPEGLRRGPVQQFHEWLLGEASNTLSELKDVTG